MTTYFGVDQDMPTVKQVLLHKLTKRRSEAEKAKLANRTRYLIHYAIRSLVQIVGLMCFTMAGFSVSTTAGLVAATVACFILSWLITPTNSNSNPPPPFQRN